MCCPSVCNEASFLSWSTQQGRYPREPLVYFLHPNTYTRTNTRTHINTHTSLSLLLLPILSSLTPIALLRNTAPYFSWQNSAGCPCEPEKPANVHISHIFCLLSWTLHWSLLTSSRLPGNAEQGGTNTSFHLHYIHILPVSLPLYNSFSLHPNPSLWWLLALFDLSEQASWVQVCECLRYCSLMRKSCSNESVWANREETGCLAGTVSQTSISLGAHRCLSQLKKQQKKHLSN